MTFARAIGESYTEEVTFGVEGFYSVVLGVGDVDGVVSIYGNAVGSFKLTWTVTT